ncbi:unnamed protein product [Caenorhabditis auriculariae]|uniref:Neurotransmitter-gated ion-channel ligand-binding domain-containing protein n=1 Tax=Caenorhabditis auriculariae TaxID=2777116 RepID=A0A8S1H7N3_9PELO|nr:unnamed protein product [Caenorhabditis auriculariae]
MLSVLTPLTVFLFFESHLPVKCETAYESYINHQKRLANDIFQNYNNDDQPQEKVSFAVELVTFWKEPRLRWNPPEYGNIEQLYVTEKKIWTPPIQPFGSNSYEIFMNGDIRLNIIRYNTEASGYISAKIATVCPMNVADFPFDSQVCQVRLCSPYFAIEEIRMLAEVYQAILDPDMISTMGNSEWSVVRLGSKVEQLKFFDHFGSMELVIFEIEIKRNPVYYIYMILIPSFIINAVSLIGVFLKDADRMSRLGVGLTNIMTMTFILGVMADKIPKTPSVPLLGNYIMANLAIMVVAIFTMTVLQSVRTGMQGRSDNVEEYESFLSHQKRLVADVFNGYDALVTPVYTKVDSLLPPDSVPNKPARFNLTIFLFYVKLVEVVEPQEKVSVVTEIILYWNEPRLAWNDSDYGDIQSIYVTEEKHFHQVRYDSQASAYVSAIISTVCPMNVADFPFDDQVCKVRFCVPYFNIGEIKLLQEIYGQIMNPFSIATMGTSEWLMTNLIGKVDELKYNDTFGNMETIVYELHMQRNPVYYVYMILIPSFIINAVSIIGVFLKEADQMSKLGVGLTNIMTMTFILGVMADKIPKTPSIPLLGIYIIINLALMIVAIFLMFFLKIIRRHIQKRIETTKNLAETGNMLWEAF